MALQVAVFIGVFMAVICLASAAAFPESTVAAAVSPSGLANAPDSTISAIDDGTAPSGNDNAEAATVIGPVRPGVFSPEALASSPGKNGAAKLDVSAVAGVTAAVIGSFF